MNTLEINYGLSQNQKIFPIVVGGYSALYGLYQVTLQIIENIYGVDFYLALAATILGLVMILIMTLFKTKSIFKMDTESITVHTPSQKSTYSTEWIAVKEVGIGVSYLKFAETDGKVYEIDLSELKYSDLKQVKGKIIELCEAKNIPYKND